MTESSSTTARTATSSGKPNEDTPHIAVRDARAAAIVGSRWTLPTAGERDGAAAAALATMPRSAADLVRYSVFAGVDDCSLFDLSQWASKTARDHYVDELAATPGGGGDRADKIERDWRELAAPYRSFVSASVSTARCLVVVRQPMKRVDPSGARDWVDTVLRALESGSRRPEGLIAANFFITRDGSAALNLAEWTSADAHRDALKPADFSEHGSIGDSDDWRAARAHPAIEAAHQVKRYVPMGAITPRH